MKIIVFKDNIRVVAALPSLLQSVTFQQKFYFIDRLEADSKK